MTASSSLPVSPANPVPIPTTLERASDSFRTRTRSSARNFGSNSYPQIARGLLTSASWVLLHGQHGGGQTNDHEPQGPDVDEVVAFLGGSPGVAAPGMATIRGKTIALPAGSSAGHGPRSP